jgi:hypothetical protein
MTHSDRLAPQPSPRDAFDVAFGLHWTGAAGQRDVRWSTSISPPELPWPLRFYFVRAEDVWVLVGFEAGAPVPRNEERDTDEFKLDPRRVGLIWDNFHRYRRMAEDLLVPSPENTAKAAQTRASMGRRHRGRLTDDYLAVLAAEHRERAGEPGLEYAMAAERGINRTTLHRQLKRAKQQGL